MRQTEASVCFFFKQKTAYDIKECDWSSDVCSSDLCTREYYRGECADFAPGRYDSLGALNGRVYSAELVSAAPGPVGVVTPTLPEPRVVLYELPDFAGQSLVIERNETPSLGWMGFRDRAASMRVEGGYWMMCTDVRFGGVCRTFGPGDYPRLGPGLDRHIDRKRGVEG